MGMSQLPDSGPIGSSATEARAAEQRGRSPGLQRHNLPLQLIS